MSFVECCEIHIRIGVWDRERERERERKKEREIRYAWKRWHCRLVMQSDSYIFLFSATIDVLHFLPSDLPSEKHTHTHTQERESTQSLTLSF